MTHWQTKKSCLLCEGGDKRSQQADIDRAVERWIGLANKEFDMIQPEKHDDWLFATTPGCRICRRVPECGQ
jgi:hypothetical protein